MMSFIMFIIAVILAAVGFVFIFKHSNNIKRDNKLVITFLALAAIMALASVASSMFHSSAPLP